MASVMSIMNCIGTDTTGTVSVLRGLFGFIRQRVPTDPDSTVTAEVSVLQMIRGVQQRHIHINIIRVGFDALGGGATAQDTANEKLDYAIYRTRNSYRQVNLGVGWVRHYVITAAESGGFDDLGSPNEAHDLIDGFSVKDAGVDAFVVRTISDTNFIGIAGDIPGECDKESNDDGVVAGFVTRGFDGFSRTFAHEIGHHLGLSHNHGGRPNCPGTTNGCNNLMAQTRCAIMCGGGIRTAMLLTNNQGSTMRSHCSVRSGC